MTITMSYLIAFLTATATPPLAKGHAHGTKPVHFVSCSSASTLSCS